MNVSSKYERLRPVILAVLIAFLSFPFLAQGAEGGGGEKTSGTLVNQAAENKIDASISPQTPTTKTQSVIFKIDLKEALMSEGVTFFIHRALEAAKAAHADAIILDINNPGGRLDIMGDIIGEIHAELTPLKIKTYAYVNNLAFSAASVVAVNTDVIIMSPISSIGGAQVITSTGESLDPIVEQKMNSYMKALVRGAAKGKGHPVIICEAFVDRNVEIPGLSAKGEILTLDQEQATTQTVYIDPKTSETVVLAPLAKFIATDINDLLEKEGLWPADVHTYELVWSESLAKWLMSIRTFLLLIGLAALFMEAKAPGFGVPGVVGILALGLFFWGHYTADLAGVMELVLFFLGIVLIGVEIFVLPGFGLAGVSGVLLVLTSLIMAMMKLPPPDLPESPFTDTMLSGALWTIIFAILGLVPLFTLIHYLVPYIPFIHRMALDPSAPPVPAGAVKPTLAQLQGRSPRGEIEPDDLFGKTGETQTDLRPAGCALIDGRHLDVTTLGEYIEKGEMVYVTNIHGNVYTVQKVTQTPKEGKAEA